MSYIIKNATLVNEGKTFLASVVISGDTIEKIILPDENFSINTLISFNSPVLSNQFATLEKR